MAQRTFVSMTIRNDALEEGRRALWSLVTGPIGPVEVYRSSAPDDTTVLVTSVPGDARAAVEEQLAPLTTLPYTVEVREV